MKKTLRTSLAALLLLCSFVACSSDDKDEVDQSIQLASNQQLTQNVYADDEKGASVVSFTTKGAWVSSIENNTVKAATDSISQTDWVSITPDSGNKADKYDVAINLKPNYTGAKRSAKIIINCDGDKVEINVTQDAVTQDGKLPEGKDDDYELGFLLLDYNYRLLFTDEAGKELKEITTLEDSCYMNLINYNKDTKEAYIHRYYSDTVFPIDEFISINTETKERKVLTKDWFSYDQVKISADGKFIVYDRISNETDRLEIVKRSVANGKEIILYKSSPEDYDINLTSVGIDGSIVVLTQGNTVTVIKDNAVKYTFTDGNEDYIEASLSPSLDKLILQAGESGMKICNLDGSNKKVIQEDNTNNGYIESFLWSFDGKYVYVDDYNKPKEVYKINIQDNTKKKLTSDFPIRYLYDGVTLSVKIKK